MEENPLPGMDTFLFGLLRIKECMNIVSLWKNILIVNLQFMRTFITSTAINRIIDSLILLYLQNQFIRVIINLKRCCKCCSNTNPPYRFIF